VLHPQAALARQTAPPVLAVHFVHEAPLVPQAAFAVPFVQRFIESQQPLLQGSVASHVFEHVPVETSHAWYVGQSAVVAQPQRPIVQLPLGHGPHAAPPVPQCEFEVAVMQVPFESQHPFGQFSGVHLSTHCPPALEQT
jgi:hypothetical protein